MIPELGNLALALALCMALLQSTLPMAGSFPSRRDARLRPAWMATARHAAAAQFALLILAFACLSQAFAALDFSVAYVAANANTRLPLEYRLAAVWGGHEGSLLLWALILSAWGLAVALFSRSLPPVMLARLLAVMGMISVGFLSFMLFTSNPFDRLLPAPLEGRDLNPLLQDPGMILHPPLLYMGYVGFSVAFAFAIAALIGGQLDSVWARWSRPWTLVAWSFLTLGIAMGSFWAYYELGWGGWWFWDAVENASFMPWLTGTALLHSLAVTEKRGSFRSWTVLLAILTFSLSLLGTFLVRSGVLSSVHAFASDPGRGSFILAFLAAVTGGSLLLYATRSSRIGPGESFHPLSRETMLLANNVLLLSAAGTVLLGTLYPLLLDALGIAKISVGPPYFETVFVPLMLPLLLLMAAAPWVQWKAADPHRLKRPLLRSALAAMVTTMLVALLLRMQGMLAVTGIAMAALILWAAGYWMFRAPASGGGWKSRLQGASRLPASAAGMLLAHAGIAVFVVGVTLVKTMEVERDVRLSVGESVVVGEHVFRFDSLHDLRGPNYVGVGARFSVLKDGRVVSTLFPEKRLYRAQENPMTEAAIDRSVTRDLYLALGEAVTRDSWIVRIQIKPFVNWIWGGCLLMALGGFVCLADRRYRLRQTRVAKVPEAMRGAPS